MLPARCMISPCRNMAVSIRNGESVLCETARAPRPTPWAPPFEKALRPLLEARGGGCHNRTPAANAALSGGLALDTYDSLLRGVTEPGKPPRPSVIAGKPQDSEIVKRIE